jgi:hypothetical protein
VIERRAPKARGHSHDWHWRWRERNPPGMMTFFFLCASPRLFGNQCRLSVSVLFHADSMELAQVKTLIDVVCRQLANKACNS